MCAAVVTRTMYWSDIPSRGGITLLTACEPGGAVRLVKSVEWA